MLTEFPFEITEHPEVRLADVGVAKAERVGIAIVKNGILDGALDRVVEVVSLSTSALELNHCRKLCFDSGTTVFWVVDPDGESVDVYLKDQKLHRVRERDGEIPISLFGREVSVRVDDIFRGVGAP